MKKRIVLVLVLAFTMVLGACGNTVKVGMADESYEREMYTPDYSESEGLGSDVRESYEPELYTPEASTPSSSQNVTPEKKTPKVDFHTLTCTWTDNNGYSFQATVKFSDWIDTKNENYLNAAWDEVGHDRDMPKAETGSWVLTTEKSWDGTCYYRVSGTDYNFEPTKCTDIYYCVGDVSIRNITSGWNITEASPIQSYDLIFSGVSKEDLEEYKSLLDDYRSHSRIKVLYGDDTTKFYSTLGAITPLYKSNKWGPVPFVIAHFENKSPAFPDGEYKAEMTDSVFRVSSSYLTNKEATVTFKLGIIEADK